MRKKRRRVSVAEPSATARQITGYRITETGNRFGSRLFRPIVGDSILKLQLGRAIGLVLVNLLGRDWRIISRKEGEKGRWKVRRVGVRTCQRDAHPCLTTVMNRTPFFFLFAVVFDIPVNFTLTKGQMDEIGSFRIWCGGEGAENDAEDIYWNLDYFTA